jgi:hypothetical protein
MIREEKRIKEKRREHNAKQHRTSQDTFGLVHVVKKRTSSQDKTQDKSRHRQDETLY